MSGLLRTCVADEQPLRVRGREGRVDCALGDNGDVVLGKEGANRRTGKHNLIKIIIIIQNGRRKQKTLFCFYAFRS